jgi:hypothetical protein
VIRKKSKDQRVAWWVYAVSAVGIVGQLCIALVNVFKDAIRERARRES